MGVGCGGIRRSSCNPSARPYREKGVVGILGDELSSICGAFSLVGHGGVRIIAGDEMGPKFASEEIDETQETGIAASAATTD